MATLYSLTHWHKIHGHSYRSLGRMELGDMRGSGMAGLPASSARSWLCKCTGHLDALCKPAADVDCDSTRIMQI